MRKHSVEYIKEYLSNFGFELLDEYKGVNIPMLLKCPNGHITSTITFTNFRRKPACPVCGKRAKLTYEFVKEQFEKEGHILVSTEYKNANTPLDVICSEGHEWRVTYGNYYAGKRCGKCVNNQKLSQEHIEVQFEKEGYKVLSEYVRASDPLIIQCDKGHVTNTLSWNNFQRGERCCVCNKSKGERKIEEYLILNNVNYETQKKYEGLIGLSGGLLSYDFYLPKLNLLIEYQGEQHEKYIEGFHENYEKFIKQQEHDKRKREYATKNKINLLEIWYWDFDNIDFILNKQLINNK